MPRKRSALFQVRLTEGERKRLGELAKAAGCTPSEWVRQSLYAGPAVLKVKSGVALPDLSPGSIVALEPPLRDRDDDQTATDRLTAARSLLDGDRQATLAKLRGEGVVEQPVPVQAQGRALTRQELVATVRAMVDAGKGREEILRQYPEAGEVLDRLEVGA